MYVFCPQSGPFPVFQYCMLKLEVRNVLKNDVKLALYIIMCFYQTGSVLHKNLDRYECANE